MRPPRPSQQPPAVALEPRATVKLRPDVDIQPVIGFLSMESPGQFMHIRDAP